VSSRIVGLLLAVAIAACGSRAHADPIKPPEAPSADESIPRHRWVWDSLAALRLNPRGAIVRVRSGYQLRLWDTPGLLFQDAFIGAKAVADFTPAYTRLGGVVEWQPLAVLRLWAQYEFVGSHGVFSYTQSFPRPSAEHSDTLTQEQSDRTYATTGEQMTLGALARAKYGSWVARSQLEAVHASLSLQPGDTTFYDGYFDTLFPNGGWALGSDTDLIYLFDSGFKLALRYTYNHAFYRGVHDRGDGSTESPVNINTPTHRLGPAVLYTFFKDPEGALYNEPTLAILAQWWIRHRYRTGADSHAAVPFMLAVLLQRGDFMTK